MSAHLQRAILLMEQHRTDLAEQELRLALVEDPNHAHAHALLALCLLRQEKFAPATEEAQQAIGLEPDAAFPQYALSVIMQVRNRFAEAKAAIDQAVQLEPDDADYWGQLAAIELTTGRWDAALAAADRGLQVDPEHVNCTNLRVQALTKLGRRTDADAAVEAALRRTPDDAFTHANRGWTLLEQGNPAKAMEHFREALRLNPEMDWARAGIVESLKAKHFIYRWMLGYFFWMQRLSGRARWGVVVGAYLLFQLISSIDANNPELAIVTRPLIVVYVVFCLLTWLARPLFNTLLRFNKFGRMVITREDTWQSNVVCALAVPALIGGVAFAINGMSYFGFVGLIAGINFAVSAIAAANVFNCSRGWPRWTMAAGTALFLVLTIVVLATIYQSRVDGEMVNKALFERAERLQSNINGPFALVLLFGGNFLAAARPKR